MGNAQAVDVASQGYAQSWDDDQNPGKRLHGIEILWEQLVKKGTAYDCSEIIHKEEKRFKLKENQPGPNGLSELFHTHAVTAATGYSTNCDHPAVYARTSSPTKRIFST